MLYFIGTEGRTTAYSNPHTSRRVVATKSSTGSGDVSLFVGRDKATSSTDNTPQSWMMLDLGSTRTLQLNHYCLRNDGSSRGEFALRHWDLEGSNDSYHWALVRAHNNDESMAATAFSEAHWEVDSEAYRYFRIRQIGANAAGYNNLMCSGIELYGRMHLTAGNF